MASEFGLVTITISGRAGSGKTCIMQEIAQLLRKRGADVDCQDEGEILDRNLPGAPADFRWRDAAILISVDQHGLSAEYAKELGEAIRHRDMLLAAAEPAVEQLANYDDEPEEITSAASIHRNHGCHVARTLRETVDRVKTEVQAALNEKYGLPADPSEVM